VSARWATPSARRHGGAEPGAATAARLLRRRQGWLWTGLASLAGAAAYGIISFSYLSRYADGAARTATTAVLPFLAGVAALGLARAAADSARLRRAGPGTPARGRAGDGQFPLSAHPYYRSPGHLASWCCGWIVLLALSTPAVLDMPSELAAAAYLAGIGTQAGAGPGASPAPAGHEGFAWPDPVPVGRSFPVRALVTVTGPDPALVPGYSTAVAVLELGLVFDGFAGLLVIAAVSQARYRAHAHTTVRLAPP
jgi:hypothetical protein